MNLPALERTTHHGIPVLHSDIRATFTGALMFAVGIRDESPRTAGITHLLEHAVMAGVGKVRVLHNARTAEDVVEFFAEGSEADVVDFLGRVAQSIATIDSLTDETVSEQHRIVAAEMGEGDETTGGGALLDRFGASTLGLLDLGAPAHRSHTRDEVVAWARRWLHAGNAALVFSGPVPEGLDLELPPPPPPGADAPRQVPVPAPHRATGWVAGTPTSLVLSLILRSDDRDAIFTATGALSKALFDELRTARQLVYSADLFTSRLTADSVVVAFLLDPRPEDALTTATEALALVRRMAADGPSNELLEEVAAEDRNLAEHSAAQLENLRGQTANWLRFGLEPLGVDVAMEAEVSAVAVSEVLTESLGSILVSFGDIQGVDSPEQVTEALGLPWARVPAGHFESMSTMGRMKAFMADEVEIFSPKMFKGLKGHQLALDPHRAAFMWDDGLIEFEWDRLALAGVCVDCGHWDLTDVNGGGFVVEPEKWRGGDKISQMLSRSVPRDRLYEVRHPVPQA